MTKRFKVVKEYKNFYLCEDERGIKECFKKGYHHPDDNGYITIKTLEYGRTFGAAKSRKPNQNHPFFEHFK